MTFLRVDNSVKFATIWINVIARCELIFLWLLVKRYINCVIVLLTEYAKAKVETIFLNIKMFSAVFAYLKIGVDSADVSYGSLNIEYKYK